jgi:tRNA 2-thiouridine synthesizing protein E
MTNNILNKIARDPEGYLLNLADWNTTVASTIAHAENIAMTEEHWVIINILRDFYAEYKNSPSMRALINLLNTKSERKIDSIYLHTLFPAGPAKQANKIAGLPKPIRCI